MTLFRNAIISILCFFIITLTIASGVNAQSADEIRNKINERNQAIQRLEQEIKQYQGEIQALGKEKDSLSNAIKALDISKKKLEADIQITENNIEKRNLEIRELSLAIGDKSERIQDGRRVISHSLYSISQMNSASVLEALLGAQSFSQLWGSADELATLQGSMQDEIEGLEDLKVNLEDNKKQTEKKKAELVDFTNDLKNQTKIIEQTAEEKDQLLTETRNTEANYNQLLAQRKTQKEAYEREVLEFEKALQIAIDPNNIPSAGQGVLKYPLSNINITQYFGNTEFSTKNPQVYNGNGHGGVDFAASIGTSVKASLSGVVVGLGNTDIGNCRSYGKWIMVKHVNGLSTLYAHLSLIGVSQGQTVATGEVIGYSGNTGYSTGPHLHFGVYATEGVRITKFETSINCKNVVIPFADLKAYLNPLSYL